MQVAQHHVEVGDHLAADLHHQPHHAVGRGVLRPHVQQHLALAQRVHLRSRSVWGGYGFAFAHSVRVDAQDNIWAVDEGTDTIVKFSPAGQILMTIGRREDPVASLANMAGNGRFHGRNGGSRSGRPTDVAFDQQGNIFVADGYFDARVVKYSKSGRFVKAVGTQGSGNLQFNTPHSIATDFQGNVYVGDRGNTRVQVLDNDLNWKANYTNVGSPWAVCVSGGPGPKNPGKQYLYVSNSWPDSAPAASTETTGERSTRWSSTAPSSASSAKREKPAASSRRPTRWTAAMRT